MKTLIISLRVSFNFQAIPLREKMFYNSETGGSQLQLFLYLLVHLLVSLTANHKCVQSGQSTRQNQEKAPLKDIFLSPEHFVSEVLVKILPAFYPRLPCQYHPKDFLKNIFNEGLLGGSVS